MDLGIEEFRATSAKLKPQIDYGPDGASQDEPWTDMAGFRKWMEDLGLGKENAETLLQIVPPVTLAISHGSLLGVEKFIEANSESKHKVFEAGFLIFATGPNGDYIVVDVRENSGRTGWLPMAMVWGMDASQIREHFVATNPTLGDFLRASKEDWLNVPKDWYGARKQAASTP